MPSERPKAACVTHCVGSSASARSAMEQPCPRREYMPFLGVTSCPTSVAAVTFPAPSLPGVPEAKLKRLVVGITVKEFPNDATTICDGPLCKFCPKLIAFTTFCQKVSPVPPILSNTSGASPGKDILTRQVLGWEPGLKAPEIWFP